MGAYLLLSNSKIAKRTESMNEDRIDLMNKIAKDIYLKFVEEGLTIEESVIISDTLSYCVNRIPSGGIYSYKNKLSDLGNIDTNPDFDSDFNFEFIVDGEKGLERRYKKNKQLGIF